MTDTTKKYSFSVFMVFMAAFVPCMSNAYQFNVGGRAGWVVNPLENYNHWAGRMRFQVNDTLFFKHNRGSNSVLEVNRDDYGGCNVNNHILRLDDGNSIFQFNRSGPFYFISGNRTFCDQGQKLIVVVLAIRHRLPPQTPASPGLAPALAPASGTVPTPAPAQAPASGAVPTPAPAPAPASGAVPTPTPATTPVPAMTPVPATAAPGPSMSPTSPSPVASTPSNAPKPGGLPVSPPPSSESQPLTPPGSPTPPSSTNPADSNSPSNAATRPAFSPSIAFVSAVSIVFSVTFGAPIFL